MSEVTEWYPASVKPLRVGVYETDFLTRAGNFAYWDGKLWGNSKSSPRAANMRRSPSPVQDKGWRGLKEPA